MPFVIVTSKEQVAKLRDAVISNAEASYAALQERIARIRPMEFWASCKFERIGRDSIDGQPQNLIEQINQMYSNLVVLSGAEDLLDRYPGVSLELQLGASSGYDILSTDGKIAAECFAVTTVSSNRKLDRDCSKLAASDAAERYLYFYAHQDSEEKLQKQFEKYPGIVFQRIVFSEI